MELLGLTEPSLAASAAMSLPDGKNNKVKRKWALFAQKGAGAGARAGAGAGAEAEAGAGAGGSEKISTTDPKTCAMYFGFSYTVNVAMGGGTGSKGRSILDDAIRGKSWWCTARLH